VSGIFGFAGPPDHGLLARMAAALRHRGPDGGGALEREPVSLGHRLLAAGEPSAAPQPLSNEDGTVWVVLDGEICDGAELRAELEGLGHVFATRCEAELVVHAYEQWGDDCAARFNGAWAYAIADMRDGGGRLVLCRDHLGVKPLYYTRPPSGRLLFASEIKALLQDPDVVARPDEQVVAEYLLRGFYDHRPETFFAGVYRVPPASTIGVDLGGEAAGGAGGEAVAACLPATAYWRPRLSAEGDPDPALFRRLLREAVERRLPAGGRVGVVLAGGIDAAAIAALAGELSKEGAPAAASLGERLEGFSALADGAPAEQAALVDLAAEATGASDTRVGPTSAEFFAELRDFVWQQEEPIGSLAPYLRWVLARAARERVGILLAGKGGDELLAGDSAHHLAYLRELRREGRRAELRRESSAARGVLAGAARRRTKLGRRSFDIAAVLRPEYLSRVTDRGDPRSRDDLKLLLLQDLVQYRLPGRLREEDRSAAAFSLESRLAYLDRRLVEHVLALPSGALVRDGRGRRILRDALGGTLPDALRLHRRTAGEASPELRWLRARRAQFTGLCQSPAFASRPFWQGDRVVEAFRRWCEGKLDETAFFWRAIGVELWLREFCDRSVVLDDVDEAAALAAKLPPPPDPGSGAARRGAVPQPADELAPSLLGEAGRSEGERVLGAYAPNATKHLFACVGGRVYARLPVRTDLVGRGDDLGDLFLRQVLPHVRPGDLVAIAEKPVAASQGRSYALDEIHPGRLARMLSRAVTRTPHGIGLGIPETMQLAIDEAGAPRILAATAAAAAGRVVGRRGWFYAVAGPTVEAIDGPTPYTLPPHNTHAKLGPAEPDAVAERLAGVLRDGLRTEDDAPASSPVHVAVVDVSDLDARVLGASAGADSALVRRLMLDNPLGQGHEQTPVCVLRDLGPFSPTPA